MIYFFFFIGIIFLICIFKEISVNNQCFGIFNNTSNNSVIDIPENVPKSEINEAIIAWRVWRLITNGKSTILLSCATGEAWQAGVPMEAKEPLMVFQEHNGVHAFKEKTLPRDYDYGIENISYGEYILYGQVALWGKVIEHEDGYRAEFAYPTHIFMSKIDNATKIAQSIRADYGCEVTVLDPETIIKY